MDSDAQLREALHRATADALELARELVKHTEEQIGVSQQLCAQLRATMLRLESERRRRQPAPRDRRGESDA